MIAIPERITKNSEEEIEKQIGDIQKHLDYITERVNKAIMELSDVIREIDARVAILEQLGGNNNE